MTKTKAERRTYVPRAGDVAHKVFRRPLDARGLVLTSAAPRDVPFLVPAYESEAFGNMTVAEVEESLDNASQAGMLLKSMSGRDVVGWVMANEERRDSVRVAWHVFPTHRGQGVGERCLRAVVEALLAAGVVEVVCAVMQGDDAREREASGAGFRAVGAVEAGIATLAARAKGSEGVEGGRDLPVVEAPVVETPTDGPVSLAGPVSERLRKAAEAEGVSAESMLTSLVEAGLAFRAASGGRR